MADELKAYYSSGGEYNVFDQARKSIGGLVTDIEIPDTNRNLFGSISLRMLTKESEEYRCFFIKNTGTSAISNLGFYFDVPLEASVTNPSSLSPSDGDQYIVPTGGEGDWKNKDGKLATYNSGSWTFTFADFANFELGFTYPSDAKIDGNGKRVTSTGSGKTIATTTITDGYTRPSEDIFFPPAGVTFYSANGSANKRTIGDGTLAAGRSLAVWIKRKTKTLTLTSDDLTVNKGGLLFSESIPLKIDYDN